MIGVLGDIMLDEYWTGASWRTSPEQPTADIINIKKVEYKAGGAANVAKNVKSLDGNPILFSCMGRDKYSGELLKQISKFGIKTELVDDLSVNTIRKIRVFNRHKYEVRLDFDLKQEFNWQILLGKIDSSEIDYLIVSDYNKGTIQKFKDLLELQIPLFVDPKGELSIYRYSFVLKPNRKEFMDYTGYNSIDKKILEEVRQDLNITNLIVTLGSAGSVLCNEQGVFNFSAPSVREVDVTGAGDSFIASLVVKYSETQDIIASTEFATRLASQAVTRRGTVNVTR